MGGKTIFFCFSVIVGSHGSPQPQTTPPVLLFGWVGTYYLPRVRTSKLKGRVISSGRDDDDDTERRLEMFWLVHADSLVDNRGHKLRPERKRKNKRRDPSIQNPVNLFFLLPPTRKVSFSWWVGRFWVSKDSSFPIPSSISNSFLLCSSLCVCVL